MSYSSYYPRESRETVRRKLQSEEYIPKDYPNGRSAVWNHFMVVTTTDGHPVNYVMCKSCSDVFTYKGHFSGTSTLRKHIVKCQKIEPPNLRSMRETGNKESLRKMKILLQEICGSPNVAFLGEDRKVDISSLGSGNFTSGQGENSTGSGDVQGGGDEVSIPLSPEQFLSEEMDHGTSPPPTPSQRPESYKLRHNNHLTLVLESLAGDESFMDVTLTAQGKAIKAHKSVLSAVSPYFRSVLKENPCQHPIIIMPRDIRFEELNNIISYIYKGEMTVAAEELSSLLKTAEILQVTGLSPSESGGSTGSLMSQMQGLPSGLFSNTPSSNSSSSKSSSKKSSKNSHAPPSQPQFTDDAHASSEDHSRIDPLDFLNTDMTCVKEEITSDNDEADEMTFSSLTADTTRTPTNKSYPELPVVGGDSIHTLSPPDGGHSRRPMSTSIGIEDPTGKPFNPGENNGTSGIGRCEESSNETCSPSPHVCPHCLETHRPNDALQAHLRLKHPSKPSFVCACGRVFTRQSLYTEHMKKCEV